MESDDAGALEEPEMRPDKLAETNEGEAEAERGVGGVTLGTCVLREGSLCPSKQRKL